MLNLLLAVVMSVPMFAGCGNQNGSSGKAEKDGKISISMYMWDRSMLKELTPWLEQKFPDIEFTFIQSYNTMDYYKDLLARGEDIPDIITCRRFSLNDAASLSDHLMDLSQTEVAVHTAENANRAKTVFLNNMSHDIRTPMNAIIGFTNIGLKQNPTPELKNCLEKISNSSEHLLTLINDVLDISRIESGKIKFAPIPVDIRAVADTVLNIMYGFLSNRNIDFRVNLAVPETPYVLADTVRIREVLVNILGNAVKFTDDGGTITFETSYHPGEASIDAGMNGHIAKPIDIDEVIKAIARNVKR